MSEANIKLAENFIAQMLAPYDRSKIVSMLDPQVVVTLPKSLFAEPKLVGSDAYADFLQGIGQMFIPESISYEITHAAVNGATVALFADMHAIVTANGNSYDNPYALRLTFRDGKITELCEYLDTKYAAETIGF